MARPELAKPNKLTMTLHAKCFIFFLPGVSRPCDRCTVYSAGGTARKSRAAEAASLDSLRDFKGLSHPSLVKIRCKGDLLPNID